VASEAVQTKLSSKENSQAENTTKIPYEAMINPLLVHILGSGAVSFIRSDGSFELGGRAAR
jgi:hypothetical protein